MTEHADLTPKQRAFVVAYLETGNGVESARRAGYKGNDNTLHVVAAENLRKPTIKAALAKAQAPARKAAIASANEVLETLTSILRDPDTEPKDRIKAGELLGKRYTLWAERVEAEGGERGYLLIPVRPR